MHELGAGTQLEIRAVGSINGARPYVELKLSGGDLVHAPVVAHWGALRLGKDGWVLPPDQPEGTRNYKNRALQSPFVEADGVAMLKIELKDLLFQAIEFTIKDEGTNSWYKNNNKNFHVDLPKPTGEIPLEDIVIPEDLVGIESYLRWERNGKQTYSPEQEKSEYEEARSSLRKEVQAGTSVEDLRRRLQEGESNGSAKSEIAVAEPPAPDIPDELVAIQSYIRWERDGKQNYSPEQEQRNFAEARKDLQKEVLSGATVDDIRQRFTGGKKEVAAPPPPQVKPPPSTTTITRKKRDAMELINRFGPAATEGMEPPPPPEPTPLELGAQVMEGNDDNKVVHKKVYKIGEEQLLVLVTNPGGELKLRVATGMNGSLAFVWGMVKGKGNEWLTPGESPFKKGFAGEDTLQSVEIDLAKASKDIKGVSFLVKEGDNNYIKDLGADFYAPIRIPKPDPNKAAAVGDGKGTARWLLDQIADQETEAQRSLMHRFNIGAGFAEQAKGGGELELAALLVWFRYMATRQLIWNKNYNVKPREISAAQDRLNDVLRRTFQDKPQVRELVRMVMATVGRGAEGDVGQRIRDEILVIQRHNDCKGGMMEEWHQKLHNNTSPDDVVICQALIDHLQADLDMDVYWATLQASGVTKERLASYDRPIVSEPKLRMDQKDGLIRDLKAYMKSLKDFMKGFEIHPISGLSNDLPHMLQFVLEHVEDRDTIPLIEGLVEARAELRPTLLKPHDRLKDIIFLDLSLDSTVRTAVERSFENLSSDPSQIIYLVSLVVENLCLTSDRNEELVYCLKDWYTVLDICKTGKDDWALRAKAVMDRTRLALADKSEYFHTILQPSAEYLGAKLNVDKWAVSIFTEEMVRAGSAASLSLLLNRLDPVLRAAADMGSWQVISPVEVKGFVEVVADLSEVQDYRYSKPTILIASRVKGEEEIPDGVVAVLTPDMPDVLSHVSVRARNSKVCFATCFDDQIFAELKGMESKALVVSPTANADLTYREIPEADVSPDPVASEASEEIPTGLSITKKSFAGKYAVSADGFTPELVGAKSRNIAGLRGQLPSWVKLPTSAALPFGTFEKVLAEPFNKEVKAEVEALVNEVEAGDFHKLPVIRKAVLKLQPTPSLVEELKSVMKSSSMPWPGDEGEQRWEQAWTAIKKVWASKWNERAYFSMRKVNLAHADLCMAVLVQEVVQADYAFVIHTTNPSTGDESEIYAELVKGLGETLVGASSGRALSFSVKKSDLSSPKVLGYPSKRVGLFIKQSVIFRSDSNGEDLEGYAGAGLYDSVPMDEEEERVVDYSTDPLTTDPEFRKEILIKIGKAGAAIEEALGSAQDIEGVIKDGELYVVQTRPQM
eukprot:SM000008S22268  [mRNA]  locus=s8:686800:696461:- [translate_table: standard]